MTIQIVEGFDRYNGPTGVQGMETRWSIAGVAPVGITGYSQSMVAGRFGGQAYRLSNLGGANNNSNRQSGFIPSISFPPSPLFAVGVAVRYNQLPTNSNTSGQQVGVAPQGSDFVFADSAGNPHITVKVTPSGALQVYRAGIATILGNVGTLLATTAVVLTQTQWHYLEIAGNISDTLGYVNIWVDGVNVLTSATNLDTRNAGIAEVGLLAIGAMQGGAAFQGVFYQMDIDDLYVRTTSATRVGEGRVQTLLPTADTGTKQFTPSTGTVNSALLDETLYDTTDFVSGTTLGDTDLYDFADLTGTPSGILAVAVTFLAQKTDGASRSIAGRVDSGGSFSDGANLALTASPRVLQRIMETNPNGSVAWTAAAVNALKAGPKVTV